jgi:hypothetical protein
MVVAVCAHKHSSNPLGFIQRVRVAWCYITPGLQGSKSNGWMMPCHGRLVAHLWHLQVNGLPDVEIQNVPKSRVCYKNHC